MEAPRHPIRNTILYGLACGPSFGPMSIVLNALIPWASAVNLALWFFLAGYAILLGRWGNKAFRSTLFPLLLLIPPTFFGDSMVLFGTMATITISWIRSGICFQKIGFRGVVVESLLGLAVAIMVLAFTPGSVLAWALGVWMFFLVQSFYFVFFEHTAKGREEANGMDAFEQASSQADRILSEVHFH